MNSIEVVLKFLEEIPEKELNKDFVIWILAEICKAQKLGLGLNPDYLRAEYMFFDDPMPPMFPSKEK